MPEKIIYDSKFEIIRVTSVGAISYEEWQESLSIIDKLSKEHNCVSVLVDISGQTSLPNTIELFKFGKDLPLSLRYALVNPAELPSEHKFLETVGTNRGKVINVFRGEEDAIAWLKLIEKKQKSLKSNIVYSPAYLYIS